MSCNPINPATGLPMTDDCYSGVDMGGSPYGIDLYAYQHPWSAADYGWCDSSL